jgi:hypothetical protein
MRMRGAAVCIRSVALLLAAGPGGLRAQVPPRHVPPALTSAVQQETADATPLAQDVVQSTVGAVLGGVVGFYALGLTGYYLSGGGDVCGDDDCGLLGGLLGAVLGESVGIGLGAHVANGGRGDALSAIAASFGVLLLSGMVAQYVKPGEDAVYLVPILQVAGAVWAEVATARVRGRSTARTRTDAACRPPPALRRAAARSSGRPRRR